MPRSWKSRNDLLSLAEEAWRQAFSTVENAQQTLYREAQLALRAMMGGRELDAFFVQNEGVACDLEKVFREQVRQIGLEIASGCTGNHCAGRHEEPDEQGHGSQGGCRGQPHRPARGYGSQVHMAKLFESSPTLMHLRELGILEKIASAGKFNIVLGEKGLTNRVVNLL